MEDTWRENQEYALRQTRICFVVMRLFRWLLALLTGCIWGTDSCFKKQRDSGLS